MNKYFPFAPGIPWEVRSNYVVPKLDYNIYNKAIKDKNIVLLCDGGFLETYFSLSIFETLKSLNINNDLYFKGNKDFNFLALSQGLSKIFPYNLPENFSQQYPIPLFFDNENNAYINCLNNYLIYKGLRGVNSTERKTTILRQIFSNSLLDWDNKFPRFRKNEFGKFSNWCSLNKFSTQKPYVLLLPFKTGFSNHEISCLDWNIQDIKEFAAMTTPYVNVVVCCNNKELFFNTNIYVLNNELELITFALQNASFVISKEVDYILSALLLKKCYIMTNDIKRPFDLKSNIKYLGVEKEFYISDKLTPSECYYTVKDYYD